MNTARHATRFGGLDGLRALAVTLVLTYHFFPEALPGGYLGVDVFFVISGFLIASLLLREWHLDGGISLRRFWQRRARRLLPALSLVLLVSTSLALLTGAITGRRDLLVNIAQQVFGALLFVSNWVFISLGGNYFTRDTPELFRNTWSLSIEEQFYVVLPLLMLFALRAHSRFSRALLFIALSVGSAVAMATYSAQGFDPTRIYFGSDTHIFGLFAGVSLAVLLQTPTPRAPRPLTATAQLGLAGVAASGLATLGWLALTLPEGSPHSFAGGFQLASAAALATVWAVTRPGAWGGRLLDAQPLRWIGERSYGLYLWHWPLLLIVRAWAPEPAAPEPLLVAAVTLFLTVVAAALSYRYVEQPVRRLGLRRALGVFLHLRRARGQARLVGITLAAVLVVSVPATLGAIATAPTMTSAAEAIARGQAAAAAPPPYAAASRAFLGLRPTPESFELAHTRVPFLPLSQRRLEAFTGDQVFAVGDSVMLASLPELQEALPGIWVDAEVSRGFGAGTAIVSQLAAQQQLRPVLVVGLGTNGPVNPEELDTLLAAVGPRPIVLVNAVADRWWTAQVNDSLRSFADAHPGVVLADWAGSVAGAEGALAGDGIHPNPSGGVIYADAVVAALEQLRNPAERVR